ncbi:Uncharacterised protein [Segatella copri]|nr:Uncharacterised protein [Segatella copri]
MGRHFALITYHLAFDKAQTGTLIEFQTCLHIEATEPWPCRTLMVSIVALGLRTYINRIISTALWRE